MRAAVVALLITACSSKSSTDPAEKAPPPPPPDAAPAGSVTPTWTARVPGIPGLAVLESTGGPVIAGDLVIVSSSAFGFAAVDLATGELRWRREGEEHPFAPVVAGDALLLPGRCAHRLADAPPGAIGCVDRVVPATGEVAATDWVVAPAGIVRARPVALAGDGLVWVGDGTAWIAGDAGPDLIARRDGVVEGAAVAADGAIVVWRDRIERYSRAGGGFNRVAGFELDPVAERAVVVAAPHPGAATATGGRESVTPMVAVVDGELRRWRGGERQPEIDHRFALVPPLRSGESIAAIGLTGGVHVDRIDLATGAVDHGPAVPGIQASSVAWRPDGSVAVAVTTDASMRRSAAVLFGPSGAPDWRWPIPEPPEPRLDPVGIAATGDAVVVFWDGRNLARLPASP